MEPALDSGKVSYRLLLRTVVSSVLLLRANKIQLDHVVFAKLEPECSGIAFGLTGVLSAWNGQSAFLDAPAQGDLGGGGVVGLGDFLEGFDYFRNPLFFAGVAGGAVAPWGWVVEAVLSS